MDTHRNDWSGSESFNHSVDNSRNGEDLGKLEVAIGQRERLHANILDTFYNVSGSYVDIGMYLAHEPECMVDFQMSENVKFAEINLNMTESCGTSSIVFFNKAVATATLVDELENNGYRVKLNVIGAVNVNDNKLAAVINVKQFSQKLSIAQMTGCLSQGFFRRMFFAWVEKYCEKTCGLKPWDYGYGYPINFPVEGVTLPVTGGNLKTKEQVDAYVARALSMIKSEDND